MRPHDLTALNALYDEAGGLLRGWSCDGSTDCCRFDVTGREPHLWPAEWALLAKGIAARGARLRRLPLAGTCPLLGSDGRCTVYDARPFGCRTYYCARATGPTRRPPRAELAEIGRRIATLSERSQPGAKPRALTRWLEEFGLRSRGVDVS
jgi:Fe-S-cluster containining protein